MMYSACVSALYLLERISTPICMVCTTDFLETKAALNTRHKTSTLT